MNKAVFFDKDGTLIPDIPYNKDVNVISFNDGAADALHKLSRLSFKFFIISNQSGIANGLMSEADLENIRERLNLMFKDIGITLSGFYYCPHDIQGIVQEYAIDCECRKPKPGMLLLAAEEHNLNLRQSWFIGDILNDAEAGNRAGCHTILLNNGNETEWQGGRFRTPDHIVTSLVEAADVIINHSYQHKEALT